MTKLRDGVSVPESPVAALPLRNGVLFPGATLTFAVGRRRLVALVRNLYAGDILLALTQKDPRTLELVGDDVFSFGTYARVKAVARKNEREWELSLEGLGRARFEGFTVHDPHFQANAAHLPDENGD